MPYASNEDKKAYHRTADRRSWAYRKSLTAGETASILRMHRLGSTAMEIARYLGRGYTPVRCIIKGRRR